MGWLSVGAVERAGLYCWWDGLAWVLTLKKGRLSMRRRGVAVTAASLVKAHPGHSRALVAVTHPRV